MPVPRFDRGAGNLRFCAAAVTGDQGALDRPDFSGVTKVLEDVLAHVAADTHMVSQQHFCKRL